MKAEALVGRSVTVAVPATVANLGAGYDVLGLALEMTNELTVQVTGVAASGKGTVTYGASGEGAEELASNRTNMALDAVYRGLSIAGVTGADALDLAVTAVNNIPLSRGLGSSAAAIVGALTGILFIAAKRYGQLRPGLEALAAFLSTLLATLASAYIIPLSLQSVTLAAVVVFLIWVYTSAVVLLYGAEFTASYGRLRRGTVLP